MYSEDRVETPEYEEKGATYIENDETVSLSPEHREYLMQRHGTLELDPMPSMSPADPYNWPQWKKTINLFLVAFHAMTATFIAAGINSAFEDIAEATGVSMHRVSYLTSLQIAIIGGAPLFWTPLSNRFGRRPIFIISLIGALVFNAACAKTNTFAAMATCRAFVAFFVCPPVSIGSAVVVETFFKAERAKYMGVWTLMLTLGVPMGPFIFGFVAARVGWRWIYWVFAITNGVQLILYLFLGPETLYMRDGTGSKGHSTIKEEFFNFRRIDPTPFTAFEFVRPLTMGKYPSVMIPAAAYAMVFLLDNILYTLEIPQLYAEKFGFNSQQIGLQFLGLIIGSVIGEQLGGRLSDTWMGRRAKKLGEGQRPAPEYRLWLSYFGYACAIVGPVVFLVQLDNAKHGQWNITPIIGAGIGAAGNQLLTTVLITYAVDCYPEQSASVGTFISFVRQTWGFLGPFWFQDMFTAVGLKESAGVVVGMLVAVSLLPTMYLHWRGARLRK